MITSNDFRPGVTIEIDGQVWQVVEFQHVKPGKGAAFVRAKIKNLETGAVVERTWNAGEKVQEGRVDRRQMQYLYESDGMYVFMDNESYEQIELNKDALGSAVNFLKEEMNVSVMMFKGKVIGIDLPATVELVLLKRIRAFAAIRLRAVASRLRWKRDMSLRCLFSLTKANC